MQLQMVCLLLAAKSLSVSWTRRDSIGVRHWQKRNSNRGGHSDSLGTIDLKLS
jgi:hypothetical protein